MKVSQIALVAVCLLLVVLLYAFGKTKTPIEEALAKSGMPSTEATKEISPSFVIEMWNSRLSEVRRDSAVMLQKRLQLKTGEEKVAATDLKENWQKWGNFEASAYYSGVEAQNDPSPANYVSAGERIFAASRIARGDTAVGPFMLDYGISLLQDAGEEYPEDADIKILLSRFYVDGKGAVMQGVGLLREVTAKDSSHVEANLLLGKLGIVSGQFDKAASRMESVLVRAPKNAEAWYYLGEAKVGLGDKLGATKAFEECMKLAEEPGFKRELENYIKEINK